MKKYIVIIGLLILGLLVYSFFHPTRILGTFDGGMRMRNCYGAEVRIEGFERVTIYCLGLPTSL